MYKLERKQLIIFVRNYYFDAEVCYANSFSEIYWVCEVIAYCTTASPWTS